MKIIFLGAQGSGKSTQAKILASKLGLVAIEMGQILRNRANDTDEEALEIKDSVEKGELVNDTIALGIIKTRLNKEDCQNGFILDGYPRNEAQLEGLKENIDLVFYIEVSDAEGIKRSMQRARNDDTPEFLAKRLEIYHKQSEPLLNHFREEGILVKVDGERAIEEIAEDIESKLKNVKK